MRCIVAASLALLAALPAGSALAAGAALPKSGSVHHLAYTICRSLGGAAGSALAAGAALPKSGSVHHLAYTICRSLGGADLGEFGSDTSADCHAIVRTKDGSKALDNLAMQCLEDSTARKSGYKFTGSCVETDADGDKLYLTYEGPESGPVDVLGGTGKFKGLTGKGQWSVADAPGNTATLFGFTLDYSFDWKIE